jgi:hypothetical protein
MKTASSHHALIKAKRQEADCIFLSHCLRFSTHVCNNSAGGVQAFLPAIQAEYLEIALFSSFACRWR